MKKLLLFFSLISLVFVIRLYPTIYRFQHNLPLVIKTNHVDIGNFGQVWHLITTDGKEMYIDRSDINDWWEFKDDKESNQ